MKVSRHDAVYVANGNQSIAWQRGHHSYKRSRQDVPLVTCHGEDAPLKVGGKFALFQIEPKQRLRRLKKYYLLSNDIADGKM
jgi:hypothetical protein